MFENIKERTMLGFARSFVTDGTFCDVFDRITKDYTAHEGEKLSLVATKRLICGEQRIIFSVCSVRGMEITEILKQFSVDDILAEMDKIK